VSEKKIRLGKGLEALIPKTYLSSGKTIMNIPINEIRPNEFQPRKYFNGESIQKLSESIKTHGLTQPVLVRKKHDYYELIAGERRYRACIKAKIDFVPAVVKNSSDREALQLALVENLEREDLSPIEEALGYERLISEFELTHASLSEIFGKSRSAISNTMRLLKLPYAIREGLMRGVVSEGHARSLLSLEGEEEMLRTYQQIIDQGMNVREIEQHTAQIREKRTVSKKNQDDVQLLLFSDMEKELSSAYQAKVNIQGTKNKGKIVIKYSSNQELAAIYRKLKIPQSVSRETQ
jgi:ParB family chromosome partitioning protein